MTFFGIKKNLSYKLVAAIFHLLQELHDFCSCYSCEVQGNFGVEAFASHSCSRLVQARRFLQFALFWLWRGSSNFFNSSFSKACHPCVARFCHIASARPFFPLCFAAVQQLGNFFFFQDRCSSSPCCGLPAVRTLDHLSHPFADAILQSSFLILNVPFSNQTTFFFSGFLPLLDGATLSSQSAA